ncbi:hypothetical protein HKK72_27065, partial [Actinomadura sp. HBU206391]|nr:hypothetical protein [Actinomadura sp. HBU206391]
LCTALKTKKVSCYTGVVSGSAHGNAFLDNTGIRDKVLKWIQAHD